ncbi:MAG: DASS family sodium-coupled anion symporter [Gammaproteobacteria bacterium]|nr:DASS family sodium-coupled anion symporter [Gammaproteobacteria bacterium]
MTGETVDTGKRRRHVGLVLGPVLFVLLLVLPVPEGMSPEAMKVAAVTVLMATFWITEAIPIPATALFPIALFPLLAVLPTAKVTAAYGNHLIYLFLGGFFIAMAIERWQLHRRIALHTVRVVGTTPDRVVLGFMLATAFLSAWISNTATAMIMVTIALAVLRQVSGVAEGDDLKPTRFGATLMLGIAYAASIGGVATLIGTPPNAILAGVVEQRYGIEIGFAHWMAFGVPLSLLMLAVAWFYLTRFVKGEVSADAFFGREVLHRELAALGPMTVQERRVLVVFGAVVAAWLTRGAIDYAPLRFITDSSVAITGAVLLFIIPSGRGGGEPLLDWASAVRIPWDIIILFGGGFALAAGFAASGLTEWMGAQLAFLEGTPLWVTVLAAVTLVIFLTEVTSNTATASLLLPVLAGFAMAMNIHPMFLMVAAALSASFAFMLPVATPPNAIAFSSRQFSIPEMARAGVWMNLVGMAVITLFVTLLLPLVWTLD